MAPARDSDGSHNLRGDFLRKSLLGKTLFVVGGITLAAATIIILITLAITYRQFEKQASASLDELINAMSSMASIACFTKDATLAKETAQAFIKNSSVQQVTIIAYGIPLASVARDDAVTEVVPGNIILERVINSPFNEREVIGAVMLVPNWPEIERQVKLTVQHVALMMIILAVGIIIVIALVTTFLVIHPVKRISDRLHMLNAAEGEILRVPENHEQNELGRLVNDVNDLVARFRSSLESEHKLHVQQVINERLRLSAAVFEHSHEGITITDRSNRIVTVNQAFTQITGYSESEVVGKNPRILASGRHNRDFYERMWKSINSSSHWKGELWNRCKDGEVKPCWFSISAVMDEQHEVENYVAIFSDISERKLAEERIEFFAHHDALTHLPNRILTRDRFELAVASAQREDSGIALLYIDLDNFKYVNDTFGHQAGDQLLLLVVDRIKQQIRETDTISRQGGDEFLLILPSIHDPMVVQRIASQVLANLASAFDIEGHSIGISASAGIAMFPEHGTDFDALLKNSDAAMYAAKKAGKNVYRFFTDEMNVDVLDKLKLKVQLRVAIDNHQFYLVYQPQIDLLTQAIIGAEALIRWNHPEEGIIAPGRFIPLAEESGLIGEIGDWVIEEACRQGRAWFDSGVTPFVVAVNVSSQQFNNGAILDTVRGALARSGLPADFLELEFTESGLLSDIEYSVSTIEKLRALGVKLSIDDFGTGYSSLSYLQQFKVDKLKIDQSFVRDIGDHSEGMGIIRAIIQLGKTLQMTVIAEGVETENQLQTLCNLDCNEAQGYFISRPLAADVFPKFCSDWASEKSGTQSGYK